jgi:multidrug efflux pump subunit AcrA (membrane-fusion protein)
MAKRKPGKKKTARLLKAVLTVIVLAALGLVGWTYLAPTLTADSVTLYDSFTAEAGDISTTLSFSATLEVKKSTTYTAGAMTRVKELYVSSGQEVSEDDPLVLLNDGELLLAGFDGVVNELRYGVGDWVRPGASLVQICDLIHLQVTMNVDEYDVKSLSVGQPCTVSVISRGIDFETEIGHINRVSASLGTLAYYTVTCDLTVPSDILPGMRATVSIPSQSANGITVLPIAALGFSEDGSAYTLLKGADDEYERHTVETGLSDGMLVEITAGLNPGDTVYAVSGTQSADAGFTLADIYRAIAGEKVVINESAFQQQGDRQMPADFNGEFPSGAWPGDATDGTTTPAASMTQPDANTDTTQTDTTQGTTQTDTNPFADMPQPGAYPATTQSPTSTDATQSQTDTLPTNP